MVLDVTEYHADVYYNTICAETIAMMKDGVRIINIARGELVNDDDIIAALDSGKVAAYVTDFPNGKTVAAKGVVAIPHLGASTPESEDNCAIMAADQVSEYMLRGNIVNSVNLPCLSLEPSGGKRVVVIAKSSVDLSTMLAAISAKPVATAYKTRNDYAAAILDLDNAGEAADALTALDGVIKVRVI